MYCHASFRRPNQRPNDHCNIEPARAELLGSALFSLSLNFKQMALYYAPAIFFFLLASCVRGGGGGVGGGETGGRKATGERVGAVRLMSLHRRGEGKGRAVFEGRVV